MEIGDTKNVNVLNSFFKIKNDDESKNTTTRDSIINYWKNVNNEIINQNDFLMSTDRCMFCNNGEI